VDGKNRDTVRKNINHLWSSRKPLTQGRSTIEIPTKFYIFMILSSNLTMQDNTTIRELMKLKTMWQMTTIFQNNSMR
jgi:BarA-like signal transduction histidine kinase